MMMINTNNNEGERERERERKQEQNGNTHTQIKKIGTSSEKHSLTHPPVRNVRIIGSNYTSNWSTAEIWKC